MPEDRPELFMSIKTASMNNWDVRISLYDMTESFKVSTHLTEASQFPIEIEYVSSWEAANGQ